MSFRGSWSSKAMFRKRDEEEKDKTNNKKTSLAKKKLLLRKKVCGVLWRNRLFCYIIKSLFLTFSDFSKYENRVFLLQIHHEITGYQFGAKCCFIPKTCSCINFHSGDVLFLLVEKFVRRAFLRITRLLTSMLQKTICRIVKIKRTI